MHTPELDPRIADYLMRKRPDLRREGIANMWAACWAWVEQRACPSYLIPGSIPEALISGARHRMFAICERDPVHKQGLMLAAVEDIAPFE